MKKLENADMEKNLEFNWPDMKASMKDAAVVTLKLSPLVVVISIGSWYLCWLGASVLEMLFPFLR